MKIKILLTVTAILSLINGLFYLFAPELSLELLGGETNAFGILNTRYFGAAALGMAAMAWLARDISSWKLQRVISIGFFITLTATSVAGFAGTRAGVSSPLGWAQIGADSLLSIAFLLILLIQHGSE
jgi:hypothetical protein